LITRHVMSNSISNVITGTLRRWLNYIEPDPETFDTEVFERRERYKLDYRIVTESLIRHLDFETVYDVGCAQGFLIHPLHKAGFTVHGIEQSEDVVEFLPSELAPHVKIGDFREAEGRHDLVACIEVAEHIEPARSKELVSKLCALAEHYIYFTAAQPGQPGHGHINCRPHDHWIQWFKRRGWHIDATRTKKVRLDLRTVEHTHWLSENSFIFVPR